MLSPVDVTVTNRVLCLCVFQGLKNSPGSMVHEPWDSCRPGVVYQATRGGQART